MWLRNAMPPQPIFDDEFVPRKSRNRNRLAAHTACTPFRGPRQSPIHRASARRSWRRRRTHHEQASERTTAASARTRCRLHQFRSMECRMTSGDQVDRARWKHLTNSRPGIEHMPGLEPKARPVRRPADVMRERYQAEIRHHEPRTDRNRHRRTGRSLSGGQLGIGWQSESRVVGDSWDTV